MINDEIRSARAESFLRIQKSKTMERVINSSGYKESGMGESTLFRKRMHPDRSKRQTAEALKLICVTLEDENKGYPKDFTDYETYDERRNKNYNKGHEKFKGRKIHGHPDIKIT